MYGSYTQQTTYICFRSLEDYEFWPNTTKAAVIVKAVKRRHQGLSLLFIRSKPTYHQTKCLFPRRSGETFRNRLFPRQFSDYG